MTVLLNWLKSEHITDNQCFGIKEKSPLDNDNPKDFVYSLKAHTFTCGLCLQFEPRVKRGVFFFYKKGGVALMRHHHMSK